MWTSRNVKFNKDCFQGAVTSVDTKMTHYRCVESTLYFDTGLYDLKGSPDVEHAKVKDQTIPNTGHLDDDDDNKQFLQERTTAAVEECQTSSTTR